MKIPLIDSWYNYMHVSMSRSIQVWGFRFSYSYSYFRTRIVSYRTHISVLVSYRIVLVFLYSYHIVLVFLYSGTSPTSFVLCTYSSTSLSVLVSYRIVSYSYFRTRVRHLPRSFSAHTRVRHYPYSTWVQDKWVQHSLPLVYLLQFPFFFFFFFFFFLMVTFSPELFTSATATILVPVLIVA